VRSPATRSVEANVASHGERTVQEVTEFSSAVTAITSAFGDTTRREIYLFAHDQADGVTASSVAERFGLHANVARHHLDKLAAGGYLEVGRDDRGGAGRPSKRYRRTDEPVSLDAVVKTDDLVLALLGRALALLPPQLATEMAEEVGVEYGKALAHTMATDGGQRSLRTALHAVADALTAHGFAAHTEKRGGELRIINQHCPFGEVAVEHPVICAVDRGMVRGMLETLHGEEMTSVSMSKALGDSACMTSLT
jgi:predicted ArsR family transcriptional regulator